jgi:secreted Zn-dependent insulinase-like peptidase
VNREIQAVDAEDSKNRQLDSRRALQVLKSLMPPPTATGDSSGSSSSSSKDYAKYSTGNARTLRDHLPAPPPPSVPAASASPTSTLEQEQEQEQEAAGCPRSRGEDHVSSIHTAEAMRSFYAQHYPQAPMAVTVVGPQR